MAPLSLPECPRQVTGLIKVRGGRFSQWCLSRSLRHCPHGHWSPLEEQLVVTPPGHHPETPRRLVNLSCYQDNPSCDLQWKWGNTRWGAQPGVCENTRSCPTSLRMGNSRVSEIPAPLQESGSRTHAVCVELSPTIYHWYHTSYSSSAAQHAMHATLNFLLKSGGPMWKTYKNNQFFTVFWSNFSFLQHRFSSSFRWWTDGLIFDSRILWYVVEL